MDNNSRMAKNEAIAAHDDDDDGSEKSDENVDTLTLPNFAFYFRKRVEK